LCQIRMCAQISNEFVHIRGGQFIIFFWLF
jgi:hypothetical protein